jgi:8-oxo-dGTP pyrophosphatase MutT (NUDIX family)
MVATPKPASTVILMNQCNEVFLTKRPQSMKFLGGYYVFPGGSVEKEDHDFKQNRIINLPDTNLPLAYYIAAARELFEEVGILLAQSTTGFYSIPNEKREEYRTKLLAGQITFSEIMEGEDLYLDLSCLVYFGHRITPETSPYRFDTRFFIAKLPKGQEPVPDEKEIEHAFWTSPKQAIISLEKGEITMVRPTKESLLTITKYLEGTGPLILPKQ